MEMKVTVLSDSLGNSQVPITGHIMPVEICKMTVLCEHAFFSPHE